MVDAQSGAAALQDLVAVDDLAKTFDVSPPLLNRLLQGEKRVYLKVLPLGILKETPSTAFR